MSALSRLLSARLTHAGRSVAVSRFLPVATGMLVGIFIAALVMVPQHRKTPIPRDSDLTQELSNIDQLSQPEIQKLVEKALARLAEQKGLSTGVEENADDDSYERATYGWRDVQLGVKNTRRLLPTVKLSLLETLREITARYDIKLSGWTRVNALISGVNKIIRSQYLRGMAVVRDDRLSEIFVDSDYAPYLTSDDEAVFVLAHELMHVAARSDSLGELIGKLAESAKALGGVDPSEDQKEDLACDFVGEQVLKRFIERNPNDQTTLVRVSHILGYEPPDQRFAHAWENFRASYDGDPGDKDHLTQYQTIRALTVLDPELQALMPKQ